jgi:hypothetical protein
MKRNVYGQNTVGWFGSKRLNGFTMWIYHE